MCRACRAGDCDGCDVIGCACPHDDEGDDSECAVSGLSGDLVAWVGSARGTS